MVKYVGTVFHQDEYFAGRLLSSGYGLETEAVSRYDYGGGRFSLDVVVSSISNHMVSDKTPNSPKYSNFRGQEVAVVGNVRVIRGLNDSELGELALKLSKRLHGSGKS